VKHKERNAKANGWKQYFDRAGNELNIKEWVAATASPEATVAKTDIAPGLRLHTMWFGTDWGSPENPRPSLHESLLFDESEDAGDAETVGEWATEEEALAGHNRLVEELRVALGNG
jgi:hypothetical protein